MSPSNGIHLCRASNPTAAGALVDVLDIPVRLLLVACLSLFKGGGFYRILGVLGISFFCIANFSFARTFSLEMRPFCYFK